MLSLAIYETYTPVKERVQMRQFIQQKEESVGGRRKKEKDVLGNSMVESARQLSGLGKSRKRTQPKKPPTLSQDEDDRGRKNKHGRGGENVQRKCYRGDEASS